MTDDEKLLKDILLELKKKYSQQWKQYESKTLEIFETIAKLLLEENPPTKEIVKLIKQLPPEINKMLYYIHGPGYYSKSRKINILSVVLADKTFKEFVTTAATVKELDTDTVKTLKAKMEAIKIPEAEVGLSIISTWASMVNPNIFIPLHGHVQSREFREILRRITDIQIVYGGGWRKHVSDYLEFLRKINKIKSDLDIETAFEAAFYISKFSKEIELVENQKTPQKRGYYLEITKPPGKPYKENHVGRFLWSPADQKYWDGREGKMGLLKPGDIILHDVKGGIVGVSTVKEKVKEVSKEEVIKIFTDEGIWNEEYSKFAEEWFRKSSNGKFYLVRLKDFKEFDEKRRYGELKNLPPQYSLQGVYLTEISPEVLEELNIPFNGDANDQNQGITDRGKKNTLSDYLMSEGYLYPEYLIAQFYTALKTKGFVILSGLTGTGKTKIAQEMAELIGQSKDNFLFLSARPDWRDSKPLLGYYNPLNEKYYKTPLLELILRAKEDYERNKENAMPYFIILDEMNLAHVEYYFADFLSVLESGRDGSGFTRESIKLHDVDKVEKEQGIPKEIKLPPNLYIIGTVNMDETTYSFSPKVLDRAFTIEFHDVKLVEYLEALKRNNGKEKKWSELRNIILKDLRRNGKFMSVSKEDDIEKALRELKDTSNGKYWEILDQLNKVLEPYDMHFGYRVVDEIALFFKNAKESWDKGFVEFESDGEIFDLALLMKLLPKFHGNRKKLDKPLKEVLKLCMREDDQIIVKFEANERESEIKLPDEIDKLNSDAIVAMLSNWEKEEKGYEKHFRFKHTARKVLRMLRQLYEIGFASFS